MKPKSMFYDEKHSTTSFWNNSSIIRWNRECIDNGKSQSSLQTFVKIVILIIILIFLGVLLLSWLSTSQQLSATQHDSDQQLTHQSSFELDDATTVNASPKSPTPSSSTVTEAEPIDVINLQRSIEFVSSSTSRSASSNFDESTTAKSSFNAADDDDDALLLTKKYVRDFNSLVIRQKKTSFICAEIYMRVECR